MEMDDADAFRQFSSNGRQFNITKIKSDSDRAEVYAFMQDTFRVQEPITSAIQCTALDTSHIYENICAGCFRYDVSLMARDSDGTLAGIALNAICEFDGNNGIINGGSECSVEGEFGEEICHGPYTSLNANRLAAYIGLVERNMVAFVPSDARRVMKLDILAVPPMFTRLGLASHLLRASIQMARSSACSHLITCATAVASQNLFRKFGFQTVKSVPFGTFLHDGVPIFSAVHDNGTGAELMLLPI